MAHLLYTWRCEHLLWGNNECRKRTTNQKAQARFAVIIGAVYQVEERRSSQCVWNTYWGTEGVSADASAVEGLEETLTTGNNKSEIRTKG